MPTILRSRCALVAVTAFCCALFSLPSQSQAGVFLNMNFNDQSNGEQITTTAPLTESPEFHAYSTGGYPDTGPYTGSNTVFSDSTFSKGVLMSTDQAGTGSNYIDTQFAVVSADIVTLDFDIRIVDQSNLTYPQATGGAPHGQLFAINAFAWTTPNRVFRFVAAPTSDSSGTFAMRNVDGSLNPIGQYAVGTDYHVSIAANYLTGTVDAFVNGGVGSLTGLSFVDPGPGTTGMSEFFIFQNGVSDPANPLNAVLLDNIVGATAAPVPEPSTLAIFTLGSLCCAGLARRRERSAIAR